MEKDLVAMAQEAEKLRADIAKRNTPTSKFFFCVPHLHAYY
jgi:hypothetical protein